MKRFVLYCFSLTAPLSGLGGCNQNPATVPTRVIAHRGYWNTEGSAQNSLASLRKAAEIGCYGSEFDVHLTSDGVAIVTHDDEIDGMVICENPYEAFADHILSNGEQLPTLRRYLEEGSKHPRLKLILEIKSAATAEHETWSVGVITDMVDELGLSDQVEYIAFSYHVYRQLLLKDPSAPVSYLEGDKEPQELKADGIMGLDYNIKILKENPSIFESARNEGITTNAWTVNDKEDMEFIFDHGADYITTDNPVLALSMLSGDDRK